MPIKIPNAKKSEDRYTQYVSLTLVAILGMFLLLHGIDNEFKLFVSWR